MKNILLIILILAMTISTIGCAGNCKIDNKISGTLFVSGNEPFTHLALASDKNNQTVYRIECPDSLRKELWQLQGNNVELVYSQIKEFDKITTAVVKSYKLIEIDKE
ncbi:hypothetical protein ACFL5D_02925 [Candidatus Neomarinimicrobiota bacterium]